MFLLKEEGMKDQEIKEILKICLSKLGSDKLIDCLDLDLLEELLYMEFLKRYPEGHVDKFLEKVGEYLVKKMKR